MGMDLSNFFSTFKISAAGLSAEKKQLALTAENIANATTTRTLEGGAYRRKQLVREMISQRHAFSHELRNARMQLRVSGKNHFRSSRYQPQRINRTGGDEIKTDVKELGKFKEVYDPSHPDADANGIVRFPDINVVSEMLDLISSSRAYEANVTVMNATKSLARKSLEI